MPPLSPPSVRPACLLFLVQATAAMDQRVGLAAETGPPAPFKRTAAALLVRRVLGRLARSEATTPGTLADLDVSVLAYQGDDAGRVVLRTPLAGATLEEPFIRLGSLSRTDPPPPPRQRLVPQGRASPAEAMAAAYRAIHTWLRDHSGSAVPVVVHVTDGTDLDEAFARMCRSLCALSTAGGNVVLLHCVLTEESIPPLQLPAAAEEVPPPWRTLWELSSPLQRAGHEESSFRALSVNAFPDEIICQLVCRLPRVAEDEPARSRGTPWRLDHRMLQLQKGGNEPKECQDACAIDIERGIAAVSDGAGGGIFSRRWADLLARGLLEEEPSPTDLDALAGWVGRCRERWYAAIDLPSLRSTQRLRVGTYGTGATLLTLRIRSVPADPHRFVWSAWAVGDSCLFWIRDNRLRATFPAVGPEDFGPSTALFQTLADRPVVTPLTAEKLGKEGDLFLLATDAVSQMLLRCCAEGNEPDWEAFRHCEETAWRQEIADLRGTGQIENDDCTLLMLRPSPPRSPTTP